MTGPLVANGTYLSFDSTAPTGQKSEMRLSGARDSVVAAPGAKITATLLGVSVPMGALTLGAQFAQRNMDAAAGVSGITANGQVSGSSVQANYSLSKRTSVIANYARWAANEVATNEVSTETTLLLSHSF